MGLASKPMDVSGADHQTRNVIPVCLITKVDREQADERLEQITDTVYVTIPPPFATNAQ
jgi:hypothetical protein